MGVRHAGNDRLRHLPRPQLRRRDRGAQPDFDGVLVRDGWVVYRGFDGAVHQSCVAHLLRAASICRTTIPTAPGPSRSSGCCWAGLDLRDRCNAGHVSEHGLATARGRLVAQLARLIDAAPPLDDAERFAAHLANEFDAVFLFLLDPSIDATNWRAEQAVRPAVVIRKVCGGNRSRKGADTQQVLASVVRTARQARPRPAGTDRHDVARQRPARPRRTRTSAAARVRVRRRDSAFSTRPPVATGGVSKSNPLGSAWRRVRQLRPTASRPFPCVGAHRRTYTWSWGAFGDFHVAGTFQPVFIGESPANRIRFPRVIPRGLIEALTPATIDPRMGSFRGYYPAASLKLGMKAITGRQGGGFPRVIPRGLIEAPADSLAGRDKRGFPRVIPRGLIEASLRPLRQSCTIPRFRG